MEWDKETLAKQMLSLLVIDLNYNEKPANGQCSMRHQMAWKMVEDVLGEKNIQKQKKFFQDME